MSIFIKVKMDVVIVIMQKNQTYLNCVHLKIQQNTQLQQIVDYLKKVDKLPFKNCIFTTKPAQKGQFTMQKTIKQITSQCEKRDGASILLCYQSTFSSSINDPPQSAITQVPNTFDDLDSTNKFNQRSYKSADDLEQPNSRRQNDPTIRNQQKPKDKNEQRKKIQNDRKAEKSKSKDCLIY